MSDKKTTDYLSFESPAIHKLKVVHLSLEEDTEKYGE